MEEAPSQMVVDGIKFNYRPDTYDGTILTKEWGPYAKRISLEPDDIWLDLGGHIGLFTCHAAKKCWQVYTYEASPENYHFLESNVTINELKNVKLFNKAVVGKAEGPTIDFYHNRHDNTGLHSLLVKRGRDKITVPTIQFNDILIEHPWINKVKMDIEGGEWDIFQHLDNDEFFKNIKFLVMEYHFNVLRDADHSKYEWMIKKLMSLFHHVNYPPDPKKAWTCMIYASKER